MVNLNLPVLHLCLALLRRAEHLQKGLALLDTLTCISMSRMAHLLHQLEVRPHVVCQTGHLAEFRNEHNLCTRLLVDANDDRLVSVFDICLILAAEVLLVSCFCAIGIQHKSILG